MSVKDFVLEVAEVRSVSPRPYIERRQVRQAEELHRGAILKGQLLKVNNAIARLVELAYCPSEDGELDNMDPVTGRIVIAKPWGSKGCKAFGLSRRAADTLRHCLRHRRPSKRPALFVFDEEGNDWLINLADYPTLAAAMFWLKHEAIRLEEWRQALIERREKGGSRV